MSRSIGREPKRKWGREAALLFLLLFLLMPALSAAEEGGENVPAGKVATLPAGQVIDEDYFVSGEVVEILGTVHGDVYAAGREVRVGGLIDGDLLAAGGNVRVSGKVTQDARVAGGEVTIAGEIGRNLTVAGGKILLAESASIHRNVTSAGDLTVSGPIAGNLRAMGGKVRMTSNAAVAGDLSYMSRGAAEMETGAQVGGRVTQQGPPRFFDFSVGAFAGFLVGVFLLIKVISLVSTFVLGLLLIFLFPRFTGEVVSTLRRKPLASLGWGFVLAIAVPSLFIALIATIIGIPLALILLSLYLAGLYLARLVFMLWVGVALLDRTGVKGHEGWALLIGLLVYTLLTLIPGPGGLITFLTIMFGLGAVLLTAKGRHAAA